MEMGSPIKFEETADEGDKWSKIQMGIEAGKTKRKNKTTSTMPEASTKPLTIVTVLPPTTVKQEASTAMFLDSNSVTLPSPVKATVRPIKQVDYNEFIEGLENSFDGEVTTNAVDDRFLIDAPSICPAGTQRDHRDKCRKVLV